MITCKQLEDSSIDYVCNLLNDEQVAEMEEHARSCPDCARGIASWENVLRLTEAAGATTIPDFILDDIEINVYKRLAAESPPAKQARFFFRLVPSFALHTSLLHGLSRRLSHSYRDATWMWRSAVATCALAVGIAVTTFFWGTAPSPDVPLSSIPVQSSVERLEQYRQQEIQRSFEDALETRHLRDDDWAAASKLRLLKEQAQGTPWAKMANQQLQIVYSSENHIR